VLDGMTVLEINFLAEGRFVGPELHSRDLGYCLKPYWLHQHQVAIWRVG